MGSARFAYKIQRRESAVGCRGSGSGGARRALPQRELMKRKSSMYIKKATTLPERDQPWVVAIERSIDIF